MYFVKGNQNDNLQHTDSEHGISLSYAYPDAPDWLACGRKTA
jgi:hypothetical protein